MKRLIITLALLIVPAGAQVVPGGGGVGGTITGQIQTATGGAIKQGTLTFSLSQPSIVSNTATVATQQVACYTSTAGNIAGLPDPVALPLVTADTSSGTLAAGTYYVTIYYLNGSGVSASSPEISFVLSAQGTINVNPPTFQPASAAGFGVSISTTSGAEIIQGTTTGFVQFQQTQPLLAGGAQPTTNTSSCNIYFSDQLIPTGTYWRQRGGFAPAHQVRVLRRAVSASRPSCRPSWTRRVRLSARSRSSSVSSSRLFVVSCSH